MNEKKPEQSSLLDELWAGELYPQEQFLEKSPRYRELVQAVERAEEALEATLTIEQRVLFERLNTCRYEHNALVEAELFKYALRLGVRMDREVLRDPDM